MITRDRNTVLLAALYAVIAIVAAYTGYKVWLTHSMMDRMADTSLGQYQGPADSDKVIVEFTDYRCSHCRDMHPFVQELLRRNPDVKVVYRHLPVFGRPSVIEAEVALAAGMQGKFSEAHDALMARTEPITDAEIDALVRSLGLDATRFYKDWKGPEIGDLLIETLDMAEGLKITGTPAFFVGGSRLLLTEEVPVIEAFEKALAEEYGS